MITKDLERYPRAGHYLLLESSTPLRPVGRPYVLTEDAVPRVGWVRVQVADKSEQPCWRNERKVRYVCDTLKEAQTLSHMAELSLDRRYREQKALKEKQDRDWDAAVQLMLGNSEVRNEDA